MKIIWHWLILSAALYITSFVLPNQIVFSPVYVVLVVGACLYFVNATIKPIIGFLTLAANILTMGVFSIVLNGALLWALTFVVSGFHISTFTTAIIGSIIISVINWILEIIF